MVLTTEQTSILDNSDNNLYISAGPGSGKSSILGEITAKLLQSPNNYVLLITFTNKASRSIISKCQKMDQARIQGGTFHGLTNFYMKRNGHNWNICDEGKKRLIIKKIFSCKRDRSRFENLLEEISLAKSEWPMIINDNIIKYNSELLKYNLVDFDDMIYRFIEICSSLLFPPITHILVDELQDTSGPQLEMLKVLQAKLKCKMIAAADDDQCQPGNTQILTTTGYKLLSELDSNTDKLPVFINRGSYIGGLKNGFSFKKSLRRYTGILYNIICDVNHAECTPNHKWLVKWSYTAKSKQIVYLMRRGNKYRVGWCQLFNSEGVLHFGTRARLEKADAAWILYVCDSKRVASIKESIIAAKYGIPTITFEQGKTYYDKEAVEQIYIEIGHNLLKSRVDSLFFDYNLLEEFPVWTIDKAKDKQGGTQRFKIQACNLKPALFDIPIQTMGKNFEWKTVTAISSYLVENMEVYSLDIKVGKDNGPNSKTYICNDGMITSNSIYSWRGARPKNVQDFIDIFKCKTLNMGVNFRSAKSIVRCSSKLIENNKDRIKKILAPHRDEEGFVFEYKCPTPLDEVDYIVKKCLQHYDKEVVILYRNRTYKNHLEFQLKKYNLKYKVNDSLEISDRSAIKVMMSCMRLACSIGDIYDLDLARKGLKGIGIGIVNKIRAEKDKSLIDIIKDKMVENKEKRLLSIFKLMTFYSENKGGNLKLLANFTETLFNKSFSYQEDMKRFIDDITKSYKINACDIQELCNDLGLDNREEKEDKDAKIELSTVHGYKGCQRHIVMMPWCQMYDPQPNKDYNIEDERRLFYVGITRAKSYVYLSYSGPEPKFIKEIK